MQGPYKILVVEDDLPSVQLIVDYLKSNGNFEVSWVDCTREFWKVLAEEEFHVVLLDLCLPDGNALDILAQLGRNGYQIPVIVITAYGDERTAAQAIQRGAADYVVKNGKYLTQLPDLIIKTLGDYELTQSFWLSLERMGYQAYLLNNVRDAVVVWDANGRITFWNSAATSLFGWSVAERMGDHVSESYFPMFKPALNWPILDPSALEYEVERIVSTKAGDAIWVSSRITVLRDHDGGSQVSGYMDVIRNITERKLMEEKIKGARTRLIQSARLAAVGELASGIAHRINNPLTTIIADAQLLKRNISDGHPGAESVIAIEKAGWKAQNVVQLLINYARPVVKELEWLSINKTIEDALLLVGAQIQVNGVEVKSFLVPDLPKIYGDSSRLEDLWVTLFLQTRDFAVSAGESCVCVHTSENSEYVCIDVSIHGEVLSSDQMRDIFEPDFTSPVVGHGTGMELSICQEIVWQHHGKITASIENGETKFTVLFPTGEALIGSSAKE